MLLRLFLLLALTFAAPAQDFDDAEVVEGDFLPDFSSASVHDADDVIFVEGDFVAEEPAEQPVYWGPIEDDRDVPPPEATVYAAKPIYLTWEASPTPTVVGYNVYWGNASGKYDKTYPAPCCTWSIALPAPSTNFFVVTALTTNRIESLPSNEVSWRVAAPEPPAVPVEVTIDNRDAGFIGTWQVSTKFGSYWAEDYVHDDNSGKGTKKAYFRPKLVPGRYEVKIWYAEQKGSTTVCAAVPVTVVSDTVSTTFTVNQNNNTSTWYRLGSFNFTGGTNELVMFDNKNPGQVTVDAVRFTPAP